jgi:hypothetical protein
VEKTAIEVVFLLEERLAQHLEREQLR